VHRGAWFERGAVPGALGRLFAWVACDHCTKFVSISSELVAEVQFIGTNGEFISFDRLECHIFWDVLNEHVFQIIIEPGTCFG